MHNVRSLAKEFHIEWMIERAFSFHPEYMPGGLWQTPVETNDRLQRVAGQCHYRPLRITLHPALFGPFAKPGELVETFLHELAHAMAVHRYGIDARGHGAHWREMMHQLGQQPRRCHNIAACTKASDKARISLEDMEL